MREFIKKNLFYIVFMFLVFAALMVYISTTNPGNIYVSPSLASKQGLNLDTSAGEQVVSLTCQEDTFWGISLDVTLPEEVYNEQFYTSSLDITGIAKAGEMAATDIDSSKGVLHVETHIDGEEDLFWDMDISHIRAGSDVKLALNEAMTGFKGKSIELNMKSDSSLIVNSVVPIEKRIKASYIRVLFYILALVLFTMSIYASVKWDYLKAFAVFGSVFALLWLLAVPYGRVADETWHFERIYEISSGHLKSEVGKSLNVEGSAVYSANLGRTMPGFLDIDINAHQGAIRDIVDNRNLELDYSNPHWYEYSNMALYSPASYLPQLIGVIIAKLFTNKVVCIVYVGRLFMAVSTVLLIAFGIRFMPLKKDAVFLLGMLPMVFQQGVSLSADAFINALAIFYVCYVLSLAYGEKEKLGKSQLAVLWIGAILIALCKVVFIPLCALPFLISKDKFGGKIKYLWCSAILLASLVIDVIWSALCNMSASASSDQIDFIIHNPVFFIQTIVRTVTTFSTDIFLELIGANMGGLNIPVESFPMVLAGVFALVVAIVPKKGDKRFEFRTKLGLALIWMAIISMTFGSMYLGYNEVGNNLMVGFQGRYLIPVILPLVFSIESKKLELSEGNVRKYAYPVMAAINIYVMVTVLNYTLW